MSNNTEDDTIQKTIEENKRKQEKIAQERAAENDRVLRRYRIKKK